MTATVEASAAPSPAEAQRAALVAAAEAVREFDTERSVPFELLSRAGVRERLEADVAAEVSPEEVAAEEQMSKLLGLIPEEADLLELTLDLFSSQIAGFYEPAEGTFYLVGEGAEEAPLGILDRVTFVHEYVHALQDQQFDLKRFTEAGETLTHDQSRAFQALVEGDAQWATTQYLLAYLEPEEIGELLEESGALNDASLEATPPFLRDSLTFPYLFGMTFVQRVQQEGGWPAVNAIWQQVPLSTEQVLHPERYPDDVPSEVMLADGLTAALGEGWTEPLRDVWGEYDLRLLLAQQPLQSVAPEVAGAGWDGDQYVYLMNGPRGLFAIEVVWDSERDATEALAALREWLRASGLEPESATRLTGDGRAAYVRVNGSRLRFALSSDPSALDLALPALGWP